MQRFVLCALFSLLTIVFAGISAAVDDTGTEGLTVTIADPATIQTSDGLTGSGNLTLTTTGYTVGDAATYGTYQFSTGASTTGFTGGLVLNGANMDLNGNALTVKTVATASLTEGGNDKIATITNSAGTTANLTFSQNFNLYAAITGDVNLTWNLTSTTSQVYTPLTNTAGTSVSNGTIEIKTGAATNPFGTGTVKLNNTKVCFSASAITQTAPMELTGDCFIRLASAGSANISGAVSGTGNLVIPYDGASFTFSGTPKTYTGKTVIGISTYHWNNASAKAQITLQAENLLPATTTVVLGSDCGGSTLAMNGYSQTIKALQGGGSITTATGKPATLTVTSTDVTGSFKLGNSATLALPGGEYTRLNVSGEGNLSFSDDATLSPGNLNWGVTQISSTGNGDYTTPANPTEWTSTPDKLSARTTAEFPNNTTYSYQGIFTAKEEMTLSFLKNFDDGGLVWVTPINEDGTLGTKMTAVASGAGEVGTTLTHTSGSTSAWDALVVGEVTLPAGKWLIEARVGQGGGGIGATYSYTQDGQTVYVPGIAMKAGGNATDLDGVPEYKALNINENGELAGISNLVASHPDTFISTNVQIADGKTLTIDAGTNAKVKVSGDVSGEGSKLVLTGDRASSEALLLGVNTYSGGTTVEVPKLTVNDARALGTGAVTFDAPNGTDVVFDPSVESKTDKLWKEGSIVKDGIQKTETPASLIHTNQATHTATTIGGTTTWAYISDELISDADFTMYFSKTYDDAAYIKVTDLTDDSLSKVVIDHGAYNSAGYGTYDFQEGHHYSIDLRVYNGGGGSGPYNISGSGITSGIGIGASTEGFTDGAGNESFITPNFDSTGALIGSALHGYGNNIFSQDLILNQNVSIDASQANLQFDGQISGPGALTLKNGGYTLTHEGNSVGGFTLENASFDATKTTGVMQVAGDLTLTDSAITLSLNGLESDEGWALFSVENGGTVTMNGTSWTFNYDGEPAMGVSSVKLIDAQGLPENFWESATLTITNPALLGQFTLDANGAYLVFGDATSLPEPAAWVLLLFGAAGLGALRSRKMKMKK
ncbi:MAG: hypothetical protein K6C40_00680 [Thermoguttaceae bacterium]|nr:hypothetical protein [Thermoguttaceae bacterium]